MDSTKFYKKIIDYLLIEDQVFNYDNKINSFKEAYYDLKEKLFKSNYISEDTLLNGIGFIKRIIILLLLLILFILIKKKRTIVLI